MLAFLAAPAVAVGFALALVQDRVWQNDAKRVFACYAHRFPPGYLHEVQVTDEAGRYITVCAKAGRADPNKAPDDKRFCIEVNLTLPKGRQVAGGYSYYADITGDDIPDEFEHFDCFGDPVVACAPR